jgi:hypothetical protein
VPLSTQPAQVPGQAVLDLRHVIAGQVVHEFAGDITDIDGADLVDQDLGLPPRDDHVRPEDGRLSARRSVTRACDTRSGPRASAFVIADLGAYLPGAGVTAVLKDGQGLLPGVAGGNRTVRNEVGVAEMNEGRGPERDLFDALADAESLSVAGDRIAVAAEVMVRVADAVERGCDYPPQVGSSVWWRNSMASWQAARPCS